MQTGAMTPLGHSVTIEHDFSRENSVGQRAANKFPGIKSNKLALGELSVPRSYQVSPRAEPRYSPHASQQFGTIAETTRVEELDTQDLRERWGGGTPDDDVVIGDVATQSQLDFSVDGIELKPEQKRFKHKSRKLTTD